MKNHYEILGRYKDIFHLFYSITLTTDEIYMQGNLCDGFEDKLIAMGFESKEDDQGAENITVLRKTENELLINIVLT